MTHTLVITAAGGSSRMGAMGKKEYLTLREEAGGRVSVLSEALYTFISTGLFSLAMITVPADGEELAREVLAQDPRIAEAARTYNCNIFFTEGGASRQDSVRRGLESLLLRTGSSRITPSTVLIHDGARPWVPADLIERVLSATVTHGAAVPTIETVDTQKEVDQNGKIVRHLDRSRVFAVQTPQGFRFTELLEAHRKAAGDGKTYTDDTEIWGAYAGEVFSCAGDRANRKITFQGDLP